MFCESSTLRREPEARAESECGEWHDKHEQPLRSRILHRERMAAIASYSYAALLLLGGVMGASKGSMASLAAAGGAAVVLGGLEAIAAQKPWVALASGAQAAVALGLTALMGDRFARSGKLMPAGLVAGLSAAMLIVYVLRVSAASAAKTR